jgi:urease accessory protein
MMSAAAGTSEIPGRTAIAAIRRDGARASLRLEFERDATTGQTVLAASRQEAPLRVVRAFAVEDGAALVHLHNVSGGLLGGDDLTLSLRAGSGTKVQITTTGATRIYRPRAGAANTMQTNEVVVSENALLEYLPDAVIPFAQARFTQRTAIRLLAGAGLFWWDILTPGREARGEIFEYSSVELKMDLLAGGKLAAAERVRLEPGKREMGLLARMGTYRTWATFYVCRVGLQSAAWARLETMLRELTSVWNEDGEALWGVSMLTMHGLVVRCAARRSLNVARGLQQLWRRAKKELYGRDGLAPRKVN